MDKFRCLTKPIGYLVIVGLLSLSLPVPAAHADMIGTEQVINTAQVQQDRERLHNLFNRDDVKGQLFVRGVDPAQVQARVNSLTDQEVQSLSGKIDQLPAGADSFLGALVFVFIVLLITDILGFTNIFPFVKHQKRY